MEGPPGASGAFVAVVNAAGHGSSAGSPAEAVLVPSTLLFLHSESDCERRSGAPRPLSLLGLLYIAQW